jgi:hypothetical protein
VPNVTYSPSYQNKTVKRSAQCHLFAQPPPAPRLNNKYPVNTSHRSDLCTNVSLHCTAQYNANSYTVSAQSDMCAYTHIVHSIQTVVGQKK